MGRPSRWCASVCSAAPRSSPWRTSSSGSTGSTRRSAPRRSRLESLADQLRTLQEVVVLDTDRPLDDLLRRRHRPRRPAAGRDGCRLYRHEREREDCGVAAAGGASRRRDAAGRRRDGRSPWRRRPAPSAPCPDLRAATCSPSRSWCATTPTACSRSATASGAQFSAWTCASRRRSAARSRWPSRTPACATRSARPRWPASARAWRATCTTR